MTKKTVGAWTWNSEILWSKIVKLDNESCWAWLGAVGPQTNLFGARKNNKPQMTQTQRILYRDITGLDCEEYQIRHTCNNNYCLNPRHFKLLPNQKKYREDGTDRHLPKPSKQPKAVREKKIVELKAQTRWWNE